MKTILIVCIFIAGKLFAVSYQQLLDELYKENIEIKSYEKIVQFRKYGLWGAKSHWYPSLSLNAITTWGEEVKTDTNALSSAASESLGDIPSVDTSSQTTQSVGTTGKGWTSNLSASYILFSKFAFMTAQKTAQNNYRYSQISLEQERQNKRSQLIRLLLELGALRQVREPILKAETILSVIRDKADDERQKFLYTKASRLKLETRWAELQFQKSRVLGAMNLGYSALKDLIPSSKLDWYEALPTIRIEYKLPQSARIKDEYLKTSLSMEQHKLEIDSLQRIYNTTTWDRPWVPMIFTTATYGYSGEHNSDTDTIDSWRVSVGASFNLFSGFSSYARRGQAYLSYMLAKDKKTIEVGKQSLLLQHQLMEGENAKREYDLKRAKANEKKHKADQAERIAQTGSSTKLEQSILLLDLAVSEYEAYEALKKYQASILSIASKLNQLDEVKIYEN